MTTGTRRAAATGGTRRRPVAGGTRTAVRTFGEVLITLGMVILLLVTYQLFYTNLEANAEQNKIKGHLEDLWAQDGPELKQIPLGDGFALMRIPRLGKNWVKPVLEGVATEDLTKGLGHYPDSAMPGEVGNFAVAGHRATHGEPFRSLDQMQKGDYVVIEDKDTWYVYQVHKEFGGKGYEIVLPHRVDVVEPVPKKPGEEPTEKLITLTTCHPRWASTHRLIVYGKLVKTMPKSEGIPEELTQGV